MKSDWFFFTVFLIIFTVMHTPWDKFISFPFVSFQIHVWYYIVYFTCVDFVFRFNLISLSIISGEFNIDYKIQLFHLSAKRIIWTGKLLYVLILESIWDVFDLQFSVHLSFVYHSSSSCNFWNYIFQRFWEYVNSCRWCILISKIS